MGERILAIQAARLGDLVQSGRLLQTLARDYEAHLLVDHSLLGMAQLLYPQLTSHGAPLHGRAASFEECAPVLAQLAAMEFRHVVNCNFSRLSAAICRVFPKDRVIGYRPAHVSAGGMLASAWARLGFRLGARRRAATLNLVDFWANFAPRPVAPADVNPAAKGEGRGIGIAVAGREERRSLPLAALAKAAVIAWQLRNGAPVFLFGSKGEAPRARALMRLLPPAMLDKTSNLCGKTDWSALLAAMTGLDLLLTPDTGLMHIAARLGVPVCAFFLSSASCHETGPYGLGHYIFQTSPPCAPCLENAPCPHDLACHAPYAAPDFARAFAQAISGNVSCDSIKNWPEGLQLWQSSMDVLGAAPRLLAGKDAHAASRAQMRQIIMYYLQLRTSVIADKSLLRELLPAGEWMLPRERYC